MTIFALSAASTFRSVYRTPFARPVGHHPLTRVIMSHDMSTQHPATMESGVNFRDRLLRFWFGLSLQQQFAGGEAVDTMISEQFSALLPELRDGSFDFLHEIDADSSLALIIAFDQFPRNLCRGTPDAFSSDAKARELVHSGLAKGYLEAFNGEQPKIMFYTMPLMHSEVLADHDLLKEIYDKFDMPNRAFADEHRQCIATFGRFPYRNAALSRTCTPEEEEFLAKKPGPN
jgi:uncharacterized protein (DUF924 family)